MRKQKNYIRYCIPSEDGERPKLHYQPGALFADETIEGLIKLGKILRQIYNRLISEGWIIDHNKGLFVSPDGVNHALRKNKKFESLPEENEKAL
ncbi:MAG: hypothetical protein V4721_06575 [Bacteroidota bacterium]